MEDVSLFRYVIMVTIVIILVICSGELAQVHKATGQTRPYPQPSPAGRR